MEQIPVGTFSDGFEHLTTLEVAQRSLEKLFKAMDTLPDNADLDSAVSLLSTLILRLRAPYCRSTGCDQLATKHMGLCYEHLEVVNAAMDATIEKLDQIRKQAEDQPS